MISSGVICVNKEEGFTSFDVVAKLRHIFHVKRIGHTGTLDPLATGVLPICIGKATKLVEDLSHKDKVYITTLFLGKTTDTQDITGTVVRKTNGFVSEEDIRETVFSFLGEQDQIPPMYSAKKIGGKKLYELARKGEIIERKPSKITVYDIEILGIDFPRVNLKISCSTGTYIRTLCNDIGDALSLGGCMESLVRTRVGDFDIDKALSLDKIQNLVENENFDFVRSVDSFYSNLPMLTARGEYEKVVLNGGILPKAAFLNIKGDFRVYSGDNRFIGIYETKGDKAAPKKMFLE